MLRMSHGVILSMLALLVIGIVMVNSAILDVLPDEALVKSGALSREAYDTVLMDVHMPVMDGMEAARKIRATDRFPKGLPIFACFSAHSEQSTDFARKRTPPLITYWPQREHFPSAPFSPILKRAVV